MLWLRNLAYWLLVVVITPPFFVVVMLSMLVPMGVNKTTTAWALTLLWLLEHVVGGDLLQTPIGLGNAGHPKDFPLAGVCGQTRAV